MRVDRGVVFAWPVLNEHVGQHLDASGPIMFEDFFLRIVYNVPLVLWNAGFFDR